MHIYKQVQLDIYLYNIFKGSHYVITNQIVSYHTRHVAEKSTVFNPIRVVQAELIFKQKSEKIRCSVKELGFLISKQYFYCKMNMCRLIICTPALLVRLCLREGAKE